jgi:hypothetical protein
MVGLILIKYNYCSSSLLFYDIYKTSSNVSGVQEAITQPKLRLCPGLLSEVVHHRTLACRKCHLVFSCGDYDDNPLPYGAVTLYLHCVIPVESSVIKAVGF